MIQLRDGTPQVLQRFAQTLGILQEHGVWLQMITMTTASGLPHNIIQIWLGARVFVGAHAIYIIFLISREQVNQ